MDQQQHQVYLPAFVLFWILNDEPEKVQTYPDKTAIDQQKYQVYLFVRFEY